jgi:hypothetical protein
VKELLLSAFEYAGVVRQTTELFVQELSASEIDVAVGKLKSYSSPLVDRIPSDLIQDGSEIHILVELEQRRIASPVERITCGTYSQKW